MWRKRLPCLAFAAALVLACDRAPTQVQTTIARPSAALIQNEWNPFETEYVTCSGDVLHFVGQIHVMAEEATNVAGKYQTRFHINVSAKGTGSDGSMYIVKMSQTKMLNDPPTPGMEITWNIKTKLTGMGPAANESYNWLYRGTMNANGEITSTVNKWTARCD